MAKKLQRHAAAGLSAAKIADTTRGAIQIVSEIALRQGAEPHQLRIMSLQKIKIR